MADIVITSGLESPYSVPHTDPDKEQSLRNLLIAKFAFLGSEAGVQLKNQTLEMQKIVDSVNYVSDILDKIKSPLVWSDKPNLTLNLDDQIGVSPIEYANGPKFDFDRFIATTKILKNSGLDFGLSNNYIFIRQIGSSIFRQVLENTAIKKISNLTEAAALSVTYPNLIFTFDAIDSPIAKYFLYENNTRVPISFPEPFVIPQSKEELSIWEQYPSILEAFNNTNNILLNESVLYSPGGDNPDPSFIVSAKINVNANMAMVKDLMGGAIPYVFKKVSPTDKLTQDIHTVFTLTDDTNNPPTYYFSAGNGIVNELNPSSYSVIPFVYKPTSQDVQSWRSQFAEKQVEIFNFRLSIFYYLFK